MQANLLKKKSFYFRIGLLLILATVISKYIPILNYTFIFGIIVATLLFISEKIIIKINYFIPFVGFILWSFIVSTWSNYTILSILLLSAWLIIMLYAYGMQNLFNKYNIRLSRILYLLNILIIVTSVIFTLLFSNLAFHDLGAGKFLKSYTFHKNMFGSVILLTAIPVLTLENNNKYKYLLIIINVILLLLSNSRNSIILFFLSAILFYSLINNYKKVLRVSIIIFSIIIIFIGIFKRHENYFGESRELSILTSLQASKSNLLTGVGFGLSDKNYDIVLKSEFVQPNPYGTNVIKEIYEFINTSNKKIFFREKTSSFLAIIEEVGVLGFILFLIPIGYLLFLSFQKIKYFDDEAKYLMVFFIILVIQSNVLGWVTQPGKIELFFFFLTYFLLLNKLEDLEKIK